MIGCRREQVDLIECLAFPLASGIGIGIPKPRMEFKALAIMPCEWINEDMISDVMYMIWDWDMDVSGHNSPYFTLRNLSKTYKDTKPS